ncbi:MULTISPECIES: hypothetical protein [unclassified Streptomyces]|uniref:hypothetical protein n=1 Tax=unclassified Streptomyces TaxID=2593676 RepID=UPI0007F37A86|nr:MULTISPECIES: hypothetical protein [unclassified Streptomyces]MCM1976813.1 hypothetical protein [Streptomyces sp. G1]SBT89402.1 hypothetical protein GA0115233_100949 [Streptomyces sp. DI166]
MSTCPEQLPLLPADPPRWGGPAAVPCDPITTSGRTEYTVRCTGPGGCGQNHRHTGPGIRRGPCGATYTVPDAIDEESPP